MRCGSGLYFDIAAGGRSIAAITEKAGAGLAFCITAGETSAGQEKRSGETDKTVEHYFLM
jgi:hypothetical protein